MRRTNAWSLLLVAVLIAALAVLATFQVRWIDEVGRSHEQRTRKEMEIAALHFGADVDRELMRAAAAFRMRDADPAALADRYDAWRASARDPRLIANVYAASDRTLLRFDRAARALVPVAWPPAFAALRDRVDQRAIAINVDVPAIVVPLGEEDERPPHGAIVVQLDGAYLASDLFPELSRRYFDSASGNGFDVVVAHDHRVLFHSGAWDGAQPDGQWPLFFARRRTEEGSAATAKSWMLLVRHHGQPLEAIIASVRHRNLGIAFAILALLAASLILLAAAVRRADRLRRQQLEFVAGVTHELNTPLAALASAGQNLADGVPLDAAAYGAMIVKETRRLGDLVDQVLHFAGIESRNAPRRDDLVDAHAAIDEAVAQCRWLAEERGVRVETNGASALPAVRGDAAAVTRAVQNLVANAIRHGGAGGWVGVRAAADDGVVAITVEDRGGGIDARDLPHLFEPFYRGANAQTRGSGLGLAIVDAVARAHGGSVVVSRPAAGGAAFTLRLPAAP